MPTFFPGMIYIIYVYYIPIKPIRVCPSILLEVPVANLLIFSSSAACPSLTQMIGLGGGGGGWGGGAAGKLVI